MERYADDVPVAVFLDLVIYIVVGDVIGHHHGPLDVAYKGIELVVGVAEGVESAHKASHTGSGDDVNGDSKFFHILYHSQVRKAAGAAACKHQSHGRTILPDGIHPGADFGKGGRIDLRVGAGKYLGKSSG